MLLGLGPFHCISVTPKRRTDEPPCKLNFDVFFLNFFFFFSLNIKDTRSRHLECPRTQHYRTWLQVLQRARKPSHSWDLPQESKKGCCVQSQASQCAVLHTWLDVWHPWPLRETCVEVLCTLKKIKMKNH